MKELTIALLGAGEMATGIAHRLYSAGFTRIVMSDIAKPIAVRRGVAFCEAVYDGQMRVEGIDARLMADISETSILWGRGSIGVLIDSQASHLAVLEPDVLIDAIMAK